MQKDEFENFIRERWQQEPLQLIAVCTGGILALAKLLDAVSAAQSRRAYAKQVRHSVKRKR